MDVRLHPPRTQAQDLVERIGAHTAARTVEVRPCQCDSPHEGLDAAWHRAARGQPARTGRTAQRRSLLFLGMRVVDDRLGHATRQLLP